MGFGRGFRRLAVALPAPVPQNFNRGTANLVQNPTRVAEAFATGGASLLSKDGIGSTHQQVVLNDAFGQNPHDTTAQDQQAAADYASFLNPALPNAAQTHPDAALFDDGSYAPQGMTGLSQLRIGGSGYGNQGRRFDFTGLQLPTGP